MNTKSKSPFGPAFFIRIGVLALLLLVIGGAFAYDRLVLVPTGKETVDRVFDACKSPQADKASVHKAAQCEPTSTETVGSFEVENYSFGRILPNLQGHKVSVVYRDGKVVESFQGGITDADRADLN
jgi:hypothetical protein